MEGLKSLATVSYHALAGGAMGTHLAQYQKIADRVEVESSTSKETKIAQMKIVDATTVLTAQAWGFSSITLICGELLSAGVIYGMHYVGLSNVAAYVPMSTLLVNIVNMIVLVYFGNIMMGVAVSGMFTVGMLDWAGKLPPSIRDTYRKIIANEWVMAITGIVAGSFGSLMQIRNVVKLVLLVTQKFNLYTPPAEVRALI